MTSQPEVKLRERIQELLKERGISMQDFAALSEQERRGLVSEALVEIIEGVLER